MSYEKHTVKELSEAAEYFGVDLDGVKGKANVIKELEEMGVTYEQADKLVFNPEPDEDDDEGEIVSNLPAALVSPTLVRMTRQNPRYDVEANGRIYTFTRDFPYVLVEEDDADVIIDKAEGFRIASPRELREFYG